MLHVDDGDLHALLDGQLDEAAAVEAHLAGCAECAARLETERAVRERAHQLLAGARPAERPAPAWDRIAARPAPARRAPPRYRALASAAVVVLALGLGWVARDLARPDDPAVVAVREEQVDATARSAAPAATPPAGEATEEAAQAAPAEEAVALSAPPATAQADEFSGLAAPAAAPPPPPPPPAPFAAAETAAKTVADDGWRPVDEAAAARALGRPPVRIAQLPVEGLELRLGTGGDDAPAEVRLHQRLPDGALLTLVQHRVPMANRARMRAATGAAADAATAPDSPVLVVDGLVIRATGPLPHDSLRAMLGRVK